MLEVDLLALGRVELCLDVLVPHLQRAVDVLEGVGPVLEAWRPEALSQFVLEQFRDDVAAALGAVLVEGAVVDLLHEAAELDGSLGRGSFVIRVMLL